MMYDESQVFITWQRNIIPFSCHTPFSPSSTPIPRQSLIYFLSFYFSQFWTFIWKESHNMWTLVIGFLNLAWWLQDSLKLQHVLVLHFFLSMNNIPLKEESEKVGLNLNIQKTKIMASGPITSWEIGGKNSGNSVRLYFLGLQNHCRCWLQPWN